MIDFYSLKRLKFVHPYTCPEGGRLLESGVDLNVHQSTSFWIVLIEHVTSGEKFIVKDKIILTTRQNFEK